MPLLKTRSLHGQSWFASGSALCESSLTLLNIVPPCASFARVHSPDPLCTGRKSKTLRTDRVIGTHHGNRSPYRRRRFLSLRLSRLAFRRAARQLQQAHGPNCWPDGVLDDARGRLGSAAHTSTWAVECSAAACAGSTSGQTCAAEHRGVMAAFVFPPRGAAEPEPRAPIFFLWVTASEMHESFFRARYFVGKAASASNCQKSVAQPAFDKASQRRYRESGNRPRR